MPPLSDFCIWCHNCWSVSPVMNLRVCPHTILMCSCGISLSCVLCSRRLTLNGEHNQYTSVFHPVTSKTPIMWRFVAKQSALVNDDLGACRTNTRENSKEGTYQLQDDYSVISVYRNSAVSSVVFGSFEQLVDSEGSQTRLKNWIFFLLVGFLILYCEV